MTEIEMTGFYFVEFVNFLVWLTLKNNGIEYQICYF